MDDKGQLSTWRGHPIEDTGFCIRAVSRDRTEPNKPAHEGGIGAETSRRRYSRTPQGTQNNAGKAQTPLAKEPYTRTFRTRAVAQQDCTDMQGSSQHTREIYLQLHAGTE